MGETQSRSFQRSVNPPLETGFHGPRVTSGDGQMPMLELDERLGFFKWVFILVRLKNSWSPAVIASEIWQFSASISKYREILRLFKLEPYSEIVRSNPGFAFKYLVPNYLARNFTVSERASCFLQHYRRMHAALPESVLRQILQGDITLHEIAKDGNHFAVTMGLTRPPFDKEGELSINLRVNGEIVFVLSFTIAPGWVVNSRVAQTLLITRLQGTPGCYPGIKLSTKTLHEVGPGALLLAALQGIADALEVGEMAAVDAANQRSYCKEVAASLKSAYDDFFTDLFMTKTADGFFFSPVPIEDKPLAFIKQGHKLRTKEKRAFKRQIMLACACSFSKAADRTIDSSSNAAWSYPVRDAAESRIHQPGT